MSATRRDILVLVIVALFLGAMAYFAFPLEKTNLGLDLQGGLAVIMAVKESDQKPENESRVGEVISVIQDRVDGLGVAEPEIRSQGKWQVSVQLPGIEDPERALEIIGKTAVLQFFDVADFGDVYATIEEALASAGVSTVEALPEGQQLITWPQPNSENPDEPGADEYYIVKVEAPVDGTMLKGAGWDNRGTGNSYRVSMDFNDAGAKAFGQLTKEMANTGEVIGVAQRLAIVLDGEVKSAPTVDEEIPGGSAEITGSFTVAEVRDLALVLNTGKLPLTLEVVSQHKIGATLGKAALDQALLAGALGLLLIMVFMISYYRLLGLVACVALAIYGVLFLGLLNAINVTMTLPGIAGIILTLGMAVDANVLIFARMRDEVAAGKTVGAATSAGFSKALRAVIDCNMTTVLTAAVLFFTATGGIKGFALTLAIGVLLSFLTAVAVTRSMLNLLTKWRPFRNLRLLGLHVPKNKTIRTSAGGES